VRYYWHKKSHAYQQIFLPVANKFKNAFSSAGFVRKYCGERIKGKGIQDDEGILCAA